MFRASIFHLKLATSRAPNVQRLSSSYFRVKEMNFVRQLRRDEAARLQSSFDMKYYQKILERMMLRAA